MNLTIKETLFTIIFKKVYNLYKNVDVVFRCFCNDQNINIELSGNLTKKAKLLIKFCEKLSLHYRYFCRFLDKKEYFIITI